MANEAKLDAEIYEDDPELLGDGKWFELHPEKILATKEEISGRWSQVTTYVGPIDRIREIDADLNFPLSDMTLEGLTASTDEDINVGAELVMPGNKSLIEGQTVYEIPKPKIEVTEADLTTFRETYEQYNPGISLDDTEIFVWYKSQLGTPLSRQWAHLVNPSVELGNNPREPYQYTVPEEKIIRWFREGKVAYYRGKFLPIYVYVSGDIYSKSTYINIDEPYILENYGKSALEKQREALNKGFAEKYSKRLTITGQPDSGLVLNPLSKFSLSFRISWIQMLPDDGQFKVKMIGGKPDFLTVQREYDKVKVADLSLLDAFKFWLISAKPATRGGITVQDIIRVYLEQKRPKNTKQADIDGDEAVKKEGAKILKLADTAQVEGQRLFAFFLLDQLSSNDKVKLETVWNSNFNGHVPVDYSRVPVAFNFCKNYNGMPEKLKAEKREAVAMLLHQGVGCLAFGVGLGKTAASIFTMSAMMDAGRCRRPFLVVPNQVYRQFVNEIKAFAPHIPVLEAYNLNDEIAEDFKGPDGSIGRVPEGCITIMTYEGLERIGFGESTRTKLLEALYEILNQGQEEKGGKTAQGFFNKLDQLVGGGLKGGMYNIEDFGFDFACYDEAHAMKKVFTSIKGDTGPNGERMKNPYSLSAGQPSARALKGFMLNQYIQRNNNDQNVLLLTATPFTNSPLEIFSMLSMVAFKYLQETHLSNLRSFFDTFVDAQMRLIINSRLVPEVKQVVLGFNNLPALQSIIRRFINYKTGEDVGVKRPNKYVLPYHSKLENGIYTTLPKEQWVDSYVPMTDLQTTMMDTILDYVAGDLVAFSTDDIEAGEDVEGEEGEEKQPDADNIDYDGLDTEDKLAVRILRGIDFGRALSLSPFLFKHSGLGEPTYRQYIETSPKLHYVMECIRSVRNYHIAHNEPVSGQVIYMNRGIHYFPLIKEYLVKEIGYSEKEIGIIVSGLPKKGKKSKDYIKNLFNGEIYNENSGEYELVEDKDRIKIVIGSGTIREGINLQRYGTTLYNCYIDYNPTDIEQLQGRIWRQKNLYANVRIVNPLLIDSVDIFLFQKLEEKTSRLNNIWSDSGKDFLKLDEFNPMDIKYNLIKSPYTVAHMRAMDEQGSLQGEILQIDRSQDIVHSIRENMQTIRRTIPSVLENYEEYRDPEFIMGQDPIETGERLIKAYLQLIKDQTTKDGRKIMEPNEYDKLPTEEKPQYERRWKIIKPYNFGELALAIRDLKKQVLEFLSPRGINPYEHTEEGEPTAMDRLSSQLKEEKEKILSEIQRINGADHIQELADAEMKRRQDEKITVETVEQAVNAFSTLNYLLKQQKVQFAVRKKTSCPPMENGVRLIDPDSIKQLDKCIEGEPQTKTIYFEDGHYTEARAQLHEEIIADLFNGVKCVSRKDLPPICVLTGGAPGSGKSTWLANNAKFLTDKAVFHLDADEIRTKLLPEYKGWNAASTQSETRDIVNKILDNLGSVSCRYDFIYDGTMNSAHKYFPLINRIKAMGYITFIVFMDIPAEISKERALKRYQRTGRYVPMTVIEEFFEMLPPPIDMPKGMYSLNQLKGMVDGYVVVDSLTGEIKERGGIDLPADRVYRGNAKLDFNGFTPPVGEPDGKTERPVELENNETTEKPVSSKGSKSDIKEELEGLKISLGFASGAEAKEIKELIDALEISLQF